jgi:hypothetical protein
MASTNGGSSSKRGHARPKPDSSTTLISTISVTILPIGACIRLELGRGDLLSGAYHQKRNAGDSNDDPIHAGEPRTREREAEADSGVSLRLMIWEALVSQEVLPTSNEA